VAVRDGRCAANIRENREKKHISFGAHIIDVIIFLQLLSSNISIVCSAVLTADGCLPLAQIPYCSLFPSKDAKKDNPAVWRILIGVREKHFFEFVFLNI
jgi:hypothetical protein